MAAPGVAVPGTVIPSGVLVTPGGPQGIGGIQGPSGPNVVSTQAGNIATIGTDNLIYVPAGSIFISKTGAYTATVADSGKEIICSGGSWTLTLPVPAAGLTYDLRNDMGISGTTGTITIQPTGGTIDNAASLALLPQQECKLRSDGTNWRSFGLKREVILGTIDTVTTTANVVVLLPVGYRYFELELDQINVDTDTAYITFNLSADGGSTWLTGTVYREGIVYDGSTTIVSYADQNAAMGSFTQAQTTASGQGMAQLRLNPGSANTVALWSTSSGGYQTAGGRTRSYWTQGWYNGLGIKNALRYQANAGNITRAFLTVKGVV